MVIELQQESHIISKESRYKLYFKIKLCIKKWDLTDADDLSAIGNAVDRTFLSDRLPFPYTKEDADWWLNMIAEHEGKDGVFRAILLDDKIIGTISIEQKSGVYRKDAEIGYFLLTDNQSKGLMTEAVKQICEIAFSELDIIRITGLVYEPNIASQRVLKKNGFSLEGRMKNAVIKNGEIQNLCIYGKLKETNSMR